MFFSGLFTTHIPYIILIAVYSVSFGIYSFYQLNKKCFMAKQSEKEIKFPQDTEFCGRHYMVDTQEYHKYEDDLDILSTAFLPDRRLKYSCRLKEHIIIVRTTRDIISHPGYCLFSRPPPGC